MIIYQRSTNQFLMGQGDRFLAPVIQLITFDEMGHCTRPRVPFLNTMSFLQGSDIKAHNTMKGTIQVKNSKGKWVNKELNYMYAVALVTKDEYLIYKLKQLYGYTNEDFDMEVRRVPK